MARNRNEHIIDGAMAGAALALLPALTAGMVAGEKALISAASFVAPQEKKDKGVFRNDVVTITTGLVAGAVAGAAAAGVVFGVGAGIGAGIADICSAGTAMQSVQRLAKYVTVGAAGVTALFGTFAITADANVLRAGLALTAAGAVVYTACTRL